MQNFDLHALLIGQEEILSAVYRQYIGSLSAMIFDLGL